MKIIRGNGWLAGAFVVAVAALLLLGPLAAPSLATTYWAGNHVTSWGVKADIYTPTSAFKVGSGDYVPSWVSTVAFWNPNKGIYWYWNQTGYDYQPSQHTNPRSYYEKHDQDGTYHIVYLGDVLWGAHHNYEVHYVTGSGGKGEWGIYIDGLNKQYGWCLQDGQLDVQAYTESHNTSSDMNGIFANVSKRSQGGTWSVFNAGNWTQNYPYYVNYSTDYNYDTAGGY